jgi:hypothetical protein
MQLPAARWTVLALALVAAAASCYWAATLERVALDQRRALTTATADARSLQAALSDTRRALAAMAAPGQAAVSWSRQATASIETARGRLTALASADGGAHLRAQAERLDRLAEAQSRLHDFAVGGRSLMASDLAFGEALPHVDALDQQVGDTLTSMIAPPAAMTMATTATPLPEARVVEKARVDLSPLAAACDALARVSDGAMLPGVLDQVRPTLGARGLAVWLADATGETLQVVASSGYDARMVERFPILRVSDDTPTSQAFAKLAPVRTPPRISQPAAVAVPIAGARGVTGVLSFEMANGRDGSAEIVAAANIVASQLASLLEPPQARELADADAPARANA